MPTITIPLTDTQDLMLAWAARTRGVTRDSLIADALQSYMQSLTERFNAAHKREVADTFELLSPQDQEAVIQQIRNTISAYPKV